MPTSVHPEVSTEKIQWLIAMLEGMVPHPDDIMRVGRIKGQFDIEFHIDLSEAARSVFTEGVCEALKLIVNKTLEHPGSVLNFYVDGQPLPATARWLEETRDYI